MSASTKRIGGIEEEARRERKQTYAEKNKDEIVLKALSEVSDLDAQREASHWVREKAEGTVYGEGCVAYKADLMAFV